MLRASNLSKSFGRNVVLSNVSLELAPGTITTLIGPSGSGKSTLLRALALLDPPDVGTVVIGDSTYSFSNRKPVIAPVPWPLVTLVFQQLFLWPHLTLRRNISLPLQKRFSQREISTVVDTLIVELGMEGFVDRHPNEVSIGQRQLCAIARALALEPKYLLLDEITSALDVEYVSKILRHLKSHRDNGIAILLVTHAISFAKDSASQVLFMEHGSILESGTAAVLSDPQTDRLQDFLSLVSAAR